MTNFTLPVIIICTLLALFTIVQEVRRANRSCLLWRILAAVLAVAALAGIALPVTYRSSQPVAGSEDAALLTDGYTADSISNRYKVVFTTDRAIKKNYPKAVWVSSLSAITAYRPAVKVVHILGYGINTADLPPAFGLPLVYHRPPNPQGIRSVSWPGHIKAGETFEVQGTYANADRPFVKLVLKGLNTAMDSLTIPANKTTSFKLSVRPKNIGRAVYNLLVLSGRDTLMNEPVPFETGPVKPVKVLLLSSAPDFETKFIRNWLADHGYAVATRAVISKDKVSQEYTNIDKLPLERLTAPVFTKFDVVMGDLSALKALSGAESAALRQQVNQGGLGVIVRADSAGRGNSWLQSGFVVNNITVKSQPQVPLLLQGQQNKTAPLSIDAAYISNNTNTQNLVTDAQKHILASVTQSGAGKRVFTTLNRSYTWMLGGNDKDYTALWSLLIGRAARKLPAAQNWTVATPLPTVNQPVNLQLQTGAAPVNLRINNTAVAPAQNPLVPYQWMAAYWPPHSGWQQTTTDNGQAAWWYAYQKKDWNTLKKLYDAESTANYVDRQQKKQSVTKQIPRFVKVEMPKLYFYLILLAACTFLWAERKLAA